MFLLNRDRKAKTSIALWIPVMWLLIAGSRAVSQWMAVMGFAAVSPGREELLRQDAALRAADNETSTKA